MPAGFSTNIFLKLFTNNFKVALANCSMLTATIAASYFAEKASPSALSKGEGTVMTVLFVFSKKVFADASPLPMTSNSIANDCSTFAYSTAIGPAPTKSILFMIIFLPRRHKEK